MSLGFLKGKHFFLPRITGNLIIRRLIRRLIDIFTTVSTTVSLYLSRTTCEHGICFIFSTKKQGS